MAYFIIVDNNGQIYGALEAISAQYIARNVQEGQSLVEVDRMYNDPLSYVFDWDTREVRKLPQSSDMHVIQSPDP